MVWHSVKGFAKIQRKDSDIIASLFLQRIAVVHLFNERTTSRRFVPETKLVLIQLQIV